MIVIYTYLVYVVKGRPFSSFMISKAHVPAFGKRKQVSVAKSINKYNIGIQNGEKMHGADIIF